jgi:ribulose-phosphate 3-epimerase
MQICPSILEYKAEDYFATINKLSPYYKYFQIDISDGIFVDNKTASLDDFISYLVRALRAMPLQFNEIIFDFHLMVKNYEEHIKKIESIKNLINIKNIFIHYSAISNFKLKISNLSSFPIGLVLNPQDQVDDLANHYKLDTIHSLQIMSVIPGAQGQPFIRDTLSKIEQLRILGYRSKIFLDGAVNDKTLLIINKLRYKPDVICPGSFLTKVENLQENVEFLISNT